MNRVSTAFQTQRPTEIAEMDLNPLLGNPRYVTAVDARIRLEK